MAGARIEHELTMLRLDRLNLAEPPVRTNAEAEGIDELSQSIEEVGLIMPIVVRPLGDGEFAVIAGTRRVAATRRSGAGPATEVPCLVVRTSDAQAKLLELTENVARRPLRSFDVARTYRMLLSDYGLSQSALARSAGVTQGHISKAVAVFDLAREVLDALGDGRIGMGVAVELLPLRGDPEAQRAVLEQILAEGAGVGATRLLTHARRAGAAAEPAREVRVDGAGLFRVQPLRSGKRRLVIDFKDASALRRLLTAVRKELL